MALALTFWGLTVVIGVVVALILCRQIENSGVAHWGATGNLLQYRPKGEAR
jgi:hypothetical protein